MTERTRVLNFNEAARNALPLFHLSLKIFSGARKNEQARERTHTQSTQTLENRSRSRMHINSREASHEAPRQDKTHWREIVSRCATWIRGAWRYNNINNNNNYSKSVACRLKGKRSQWTRRNAMWRVNCMWVCLCACVKNTDAVRTFILLQNLATTPLSRAGIIWISNRTCQRVESNRIASLKYNFLFVVQTLSNIERELCMPWNRVKYLTSRVALSVFR